VNHPRQPAPQTGSFWPPKDRKELQVWQVCKDRQAPKALKGFKV